MIKEVVYTVPTDLISPTESIDDVKEKIIDVYQSIVDGPLDEQMAFIGYVALETQGRFYDEFTIFHCIGNLQTNIEAIDRLVLSVKSMFVSKRQSYIYLAKLFLKKYYKKSFNDVEYSISILSVLQKIVKRLTHNLSNNQDHLKVAMEYAKARKIKSIVKSKKEK